MLWTIILLIVAIFLPPLAVAMMTGIGKDFWINLLLTLLFWAPGTVHAVFLVLTRSETARA